MRSTFSSRRRRSGAWCWAPRQGRPPCPVRADQVHLQQVLLNLAANGMDAMRAAHPASADWKSATALNGGSEVEVSVADSGTGIPNDQAEGHLRDVLYDQAAGHRAWPVDRAHASSRPTAAGSGRRTEPAAARCFVSPCRWPRPGRHDAPTLRHSHRRRRRVVSHRGRPLAAGVRAIRSPSTNSGDQLLANPPGSDARLHLARHANVRSQRARIAGSSREAGQHPADRLPDRAWQTFR